MTQIIVTNEKKEISMDNKLYKIIGIKSNFKNKAKNILLKSPRKRRKSEITTVGNLIKDEIMKFRQNNKNTEYLNKNSSKDANLHIIKNIHYQIQFSISKQINKLSNFQTNTKNQNKNKKKKGKLRNKDIKIIKKNKLLNNNVNA